MTWGYYMDQHEDRVWIEDPLDPHRAWLVYKDGGFDVLTDNPYLEEEDEDDRDEHRQQAGY